jgi:hypothetical protein
MLISHTNTNQKIQNTVDLLATKLALPREEDTLVWDSLNITDFDQLIGVVHNNDNDDDYKDWKCSIFVPDIDDYNEVSTKYADEEAVLYEFSTMLRKHIKRSQAICDEAVLSLSFHNVGIVCDASKDDVYEKQVKRWKKRVQRLLSRLQDQERRLTNVVARNIQQRRKLCMNLATYFSYGNDPLVSRFQKELRLIWVK